MSGFSSQPDQSMHGVRNRIPMLCSVFVALLLTGVAAAGLAETGSASRRADRATEIEQRLLAPCCWTQTLDVHESELSTALRIEIRTRLTQGEAPASIEDELALRFGERIRAVPRGNDVRAAVPIVIGTGMVLSLFALLVFVRRGRRLSLEELRRELLRDEPTLDEYDRELERALRRDRS